MAVLILSCPAVLSYQQTPPTQKCCSPGVLEHVSILSVAFTVFIIYIAHVID